MDLALLSGIATFLYQGSKRTNFLFRLPTRDFRWTHLQEWVSWTALMVVAGFLLTRCSITIPGLPHWTVAVGGYTVLAGAFLFGLPEGLALLAKLLRRHMRLPPPKRR